MNVTLVYQGRYWVRQALELETLSALIQRQGHRVRLVYDSDALGVTDNVLQIPWLARRLSSSQHIVNQIVSSRPDLVLMSVLPASYAWARQVACQVKKAAPVPVVLIGLHPSLVPERVMADPCVDAVIVGEVENAIGPLLSGAAARLLDADLLAAVPNLRYRRGGNLVANPAAALVDLDALPLPDKELFRPWISHSYSYAAMVSRGCPYSCTFCEETCAKGLHGRAYYRRKSVDSIMAELEAGKRKYRFREVIFKDSYLSGNVEWLAALMERYRREIRVPFKCFCTVRGFTRRTAQLLKEGGCYSVEFGLQTWNEHVRREILGRSETNEQAVEAFGNCASQKLWYDVDHMFNLPGETLQDHLVGAGMYSRLRYLNRVKVHHLVYLPAAPIVDHGLAAGVLPVDIRERLADGWASDFYDQGAVSQPAQRTEVAAFAALYKLLPVLPSGLLRAMTVGKRVRMLGCIPSPLMATLQGLIALRSGDLRFAAYLSLYPRKIAHAAAARFRRMTRKPGATATVGNEVCT